MLRRLGLRLRLGADIENSEKAEVAGCQSRDVWQIEALSNPN
jgi:hypothetical protein